MDAFNLGSTTEPDYSMALAKINTMTRDELNELLNDENKLDDYIKSLEQVRTFAFSNFGLSRREMTHLSICICLVVRARAKPERERFLQVQFE